MISLNSLKFKSRAAFSFGWLIIYEILNFFYNWSMLLTHTLSHYQWKAYKKAFRDEK